MKDWNGANSLVLDKLKNPSSSWVCVGCIWSCGWNAPPGKSAKEGQKRGPNTASYSHYLEILPDESWHYENASKGEKPIILSWLYRNSSNPWWMVVADSGKKQLIPWAYWNMGNSKKVHLDDELIEVGELILVEEIANILTLGATKSSVEAGSYTSNEWIRCGEKLILFEKKYSFLRESSWFRLALWLAQRDEEAVRLRQEQELLVRKTKKTSGEIHATRRSAKRKTSNTNR